MKMKKLKFFLALYLALCTVFNAVMFSYITAYASAGSGMTEHDETVADALYGKGNWTYNEETGEIVPDNTALAGARDALLTGFGIVYDGLKAGQTVAEWGIGVLKDSINKFWDAINVKDGNVVLPKECVDELHDSLLNNENLTRLQGYYLLESNITKNDIKGFYTNENNPSFVMIYQSLIDECKDYDMFLEKNGSDLRVFFVSADQKYLSTNISSYSKMPLLYFYDSNLEYHFIDYYIYASINSSSKPSLNEQGSYVVSPVHPYFIGYAGNPRKIFYSNTDLQIYLNQLKGIGSRNVYISQDFYNYKSSELNINIDKLHSTNWTTQNQTIYNEIIDNRNETIVNTEVDVLADVDLQAIIDTTIKKYMYQTGDNPGGGGGGGGSGGTLVIPEETQNILEQIYSVLSIISAWVEPIYDRVGDILTEIKNLENELFLVRLSNIMAELKNITKAINNLDFTGNGGSIDISDSIQTLIDFLESKFSELFKILESFDFDSGGKSIFDYLLEWLLNQADHFGNFLDTLLGNLLADIIMFFIGDGGLSDLVIVPARALASEAKSRFPTSIPWDIIAIIGIFSASPETPYFELPFSIPKLGIDEKIVIDFEKAENLGKLSRSMFEVTFLLFLVIQTRKLYGSVNSN